MRYLFFLAILLVWGVSRGQGSGFSFSYTGPTQILVGPDCEAELEWGHPNTPTVTSNIPGGFIVSFDIFSISLGYEIGDLVPGGTTVTVFYQALDNFGNTALFGFAINFIDILPPIFDPFSLPSNITISCSNNLPPPAMVEATDNCDNENANLTITYTQTGSAPLCTGGILTRNWVADDDLGNQATFIQTITVNPDNTPPVIANTLQNGMAPCSTAMAQYTTWINAQRAAFSATDNGCGIMSLTDNAPPPAIITSFCGIIEVTFTAKDNCNNTSTVVKTFTIFNNVAPVITTPASGASGNCGQSNIAQVFNTWINTHGGATATDDCSSIFWSTFPASPSIADTCDAAIDVMFIAGDGCNNFDTTSASFVLTDDTGPTIMPDPGTMILSCTVAGLDSTLMDWLVTGGHSDAHDLCTSDEDLMLGYRLGGNELSLQEVLDAWQDSLLSGCQDGVIIGGIGINNVKAYLQVEFTYTDNCDNESGETSYFGITDNGRPQFVTNPVDTSFACSQSSSWEDVFMEWYNTAGASSYTDLCSAVTVNASITADSAIQYLTAALDTACLQGVAVSIQFGLVDECGNTSLTNPSGTFSLQDTVAPVLVTHAADITFPCSGNAQMQLQSWIDTLGGMVATDGCGSLTFEFSWADTSGLTQTGIPGTGPYPEINNLDCSSGIEVIFTALDICQNTISDTAIFSISDSLPPVILISEDTIHLACLDTVPLNLPSVTDGCDANPTVSFTDSVSVDSCLGLPEFILRTWSAMDDCGNTSVAQVWYFRIDSVPPTFDLPIDTVVFCSVDTLLLLNVQDHCDPAPVVTWEDLLTGMTCNQILTRTWTVTDACGNFSTAVQLFNLSDDSPPLITYSPGNYVFACDTSTADLQSTYEEWMDSVTIADGCSAAAYFIALRNSYVLEDTATWPGTPLPDSIMVMCGSNVGIEADLVAYDECGNVVVDPISFTVNDTLGPVFIDCPEIIFIEPDTATCDALVTLTIPSYEEVCFPDDVKIQLIIDGGDTLAMDSTLSIDTLLRVGIHTVVWIGSDCNGNTGTCNSLIEIIDENALSVSCPADTLLFTTTESCQAVLPIFPAETITGSCGLGVITWSGYIEGMADPSAFIFDSAVDTIQVEFTSGVHLVYLIAQDSTGDSDTCFYTVELRDTFPPDILCQADSVSLHPSGLEGINVASLSLLVSNTDACGIDTVLYDPPFVNCAQSGQMVPVTITAIDQSGNSSVCVAQLDVQTQALNPLWESQLCDDTLRLFANIPDGPVTIYTYSWTGPNSFVSGDADPVIPDADTSFSGTYMLTVQSENGCVSIGTVDIVIEELTAPAMMISADTLCAGTEITFTTQTFSGDVSYQWYHVTTAGDTLLGTGPEPQFTYVPDQIGMYNVYSIVTQDTCSSEQGQVVSFEVIAVPIAEIEDVSMILCVDDTLFLSPVNPLDSLQYAWTGPGGYEAFVPSPPGIPAGELDASSLFTLVVSNAYCSSEPDSAVASVQPVPALPVITGDAFTCEGGMLVLTTTVPYNDYLWIDPLGNTIPSDQDTLLLSPALMTQSGDWHVIVFENGCPSDTSMAFTVQIDAALQININAEQQFCEGDSITLAVEPVIAGEYTWTGPGGFMSNEETPTTLALGGTYYASLLASTGCEAIDSHEVLVDNLPVIISLQTDADSCANGTDAITIWAETQPPFAGDFEYMWTGPAAFVVQDSSIVIDSATSAINGIYSLVIVNGLCTTEVSSTEITLRDGPATPVILGDNVYCYGETITLSIESPVDGGQYAWTSSDTSVVLDSPGTLIIPGATPAWTGIYTVSVTVDGCTSMSSMKGVQVKSALSAPSILSMPLVCEGDSLVLVSNAPPGSNLHWVGSNGFDSMEEQPVIYPFTPADAGTYQVLYILNDCSSPASNPFEINIQLTVTAPGLLADQMAVCIDNPVPITICIDPATGSEGALYTWLLNANTVLGSSATDSCITIQGNTLQGGINVITAIAALQGCPSDTGTALLITGDEVPKQQADAGFDAEFCPGETIILDGSDPSPASGVWSSTDGLVVFGDENDPSSEVFGLPSGDYSLTWTLSYASCVNYDLDSMLLSVLFSPETNPDTVNVPFGQTAEFTVTLNDLIPLGPYTLVIVTPPQKGNALHVGNGIIRYTPNIGFVGTDMLVYRICAVDCPEECSEATVVLKVGDEDDCFVPTMFTPNGDGVNDLLIVPCLETERFPRNKIFIFNEWGDAVFLASPYLNNWDGTHSGDPLPVGTYFYIMDFGDGSTPKRSFLILEK